MKKTLSANTIHSCFGVGWAGARRGLPQMGHLRRLLAGPLQDQRKQRELYFEQRHREIFKSVQQRHWRHDRTEFSKVLLHAPGLQRF